jgi:hypothetical protein
MWKCESLEGLSVGFLSSVNTFLAEISQPIILIWIVTEYF